MKISTPQLGGGTQQRIVLIPDDFFTVENSVQGNGCYLVENCDIPPYVRPVRGWKIVGRGKAPWPGCSEGHAVVLENTTSASDCVTHRGEEFPEGTRLWQHFCERWLPNENGALHRQPEEGEG